MIWKGIIGSAMLLSFAASCSLPSRVAPSGSNPHPSKPSGPSAEPTADSLADGCLDQSGRVCIHGTDETFQDHTEQFGDGQFNHSSQRLLATFSLYATGPGRLEGTAIIEHTLTGDFDYVMCSGTYQIEPRRYEARLTGEYTDVPGTDQVYVSFIADPPQGPLPVTTWKTNCEVQPDFMPQTWAWSGFGGALENGIYDFQADWSGPDVGEFWQKVHMEQGGGP